MGKKQKLKKAAQLAAKLKGEIKTLDEEVAAKEAGSRVESSGGSPGCSAKKEPIKMDSRYRKNLNKLMSLAQKLPVNLLAHMECPEEPQSSKAEFSGCDEGESTDSEDESPDLVGTQDFQDKLEDLSNLGQLALRSADSNKQSRGEKKARRLLMKLDLKPMENVYRVTMIKSKNILLYINQPEVYKVPHSQTIICFGQIRVEDLTNAAATQAAERYRIPTGEDCKKADATVANDDDDDDGEVDEEAAKDLDEKDIELVQMQAACSRKKAMKALLKQGNDVVNAIMALTVG
ncbi:nascent polypeptide-associated complex subunit alpha [Drosophila gunungcola]|uniref:nascent polypeptide-associated complex subunit alpha n=1 Tax=Drosophila gunungcola TaxID=103775 RepID=UPI0022E36040|nr:nascent polypeptide-associated complex subunit alpha [Drosophila gunungcola]